MFQRILPNAKMAVQPNRRKKEDENDGLLVFGYSCKLYPSDEKSQQINEERHLQSWNGDGSLRIDRYDCRLLLTTIDDHVREQNEEECPTEQMEDEMCEEERYKDMYLDIQAQAARLDEESRKKTEIAFDYGGAKAKPAPVEEDSESEEEPFVAPIGIKLPVGLATPENLKQSHIIDRTAMFVVEKGPQMEIVIKAKQRNNTEQFGFLDFDNMLYPYYKYISKLIREKKYTPAFKTKEERAQEKKETESKSSNALAAIASQHSDSELDSDSDTELHPSLFAVQKREPSPDILDRTKNAHGPRQKPIVEPATVSHVRADYKITQSNDMYASLFKNLTGYVEPKPERKQPDPVRPASVPVIQEEVIAEKDPDVDIEWQQWWMKFYGRPPIAKAPSPMIPPPPDMEPIVCRYAEFVARHGAQAELGLVGRPDLKLHFMDPVSPFFSYYQHKVRYAQWEMAQEMPAPVLEHEDFAQPNSPGLMNRKQRRRLQDAQKVGPAPPPGVIDPFLLKPKIQADLELHKTQSCPANLGTPEAKCERKPYFSGAPVSFSLAKEEIKIVPFTSLNDEENDLETIHSPIPSPSSHEALSSPALNTTQQLDRKEKARIFMEKLLIDKKNQKVREAEDAKIRELEKQREEIEMKLAEAEAEKPAEKKPAEIASKPLNLNLIDELISSRIDNLLQASGMAPVERKRSLDEKERSRDKKSKKHKRKRSRSRDRSRDRRRRRSRSRSPERKSRRRS